MTKIWILRTLVAERLTAAAEEIFSAVERNITEKKTLNTPAQRAVVHERLSLLADEILRLLEVVMGDSEAGECGSHGEIERHRQLLDVTLKTEANSNRTDGLCRSAGEKHVSCEQSSKDVSTETDSEVIHGKTFHLHQTQRADKSTSTVTETGTRVEQRGPPSNNSGAASEKSIKANKKLRGQNKKKVKRRVAPSDEVHTAGRSCCRVCGKVFWYKRSFLKHLLQHEQSSDLCGACGKPLDFGESLETHLQTHSEESICGGQTEDGRSEAKREVGDNEDWKNSDNGDEKAETGLQTTQQRSNKPKVPKNKDTSGLKYRCKVCGKSFCYRASFLKHVQEDERDGDVCGVCGKHFEFEESLRLHLQTYIRTEDCEVCGKHFDGRKQLEMHMRTHTGEKPYICAVCGKAFTQNGNLMGHMRVHTGERPYVCSVCGQSFGFKEYMTAHMRIHTGEKPFTCGVCGKGFRQRGTLKTHTMIHTGESMHRCGVCDKKFYKSAALKIHMRSHTGEKPYVCNICGKSFAAGGSLTKHMGIHEGQRMQKSQPQFLENMIM